VHYLNCGDWVESCTAIVETLDGELRVIHWPEGVRDGVASSRVVVVAAG
jgi:hypothetical protein